MATVVIIVGHFSCPGVNALCTVEKCCGVVLSDSITLIFKPTTVVSSPPPDTVGVYVIQDIDIGQ